MLENGFLAFVNVNAARLAIELSDGTYALVEQLGASSVGAGTSLSGEFRTFGETQLKELPSGTVHSVFVLAYDLSQEAVVQALR